MQKLNLLGSILHNIYVLALYSFIHKGRKKKTGAATQGYTGAITLFP